MALTDRIVKIADATRNKTGKTNKLTLDEIATEIEGIKTNPILQDKVVEITENGTTNIVADEGYDGLNNVEVTTNVAGSTSYEETEVDFSKLSSQNISVKQDGTTGSWGGWFLYTSIDVSEVISIKYSGVPCYSASNLYLYGIVFYDENSRFLSGIGVNEADSYTSMSGPDLSSADCIISGETQIPENAKYLRVGYAVISDVKYPPQVTLLKKTNWEPNLQDKTITITENGTQTITFDEGYDGLKNITINIQVEAGTQGENIADYQLVEYIKTTNYNYNSNYIETGVIPTSKTSIEMQYSFYQLNNQYSKLYGTKKTWAECIAQSDTRIVSVWNGNVSGNLSTLNNYNKHIIKQDKNVLYFDGTLAKTFPEAEWEDTNVLRLFSATDTNGDSTAQYYYCKIWEDDVLIRDFVPCYRKADNVIGMFDKVENKFYENKGTTAFQKGANI